MLIERIQEDLKQAQLSRDEQKVSTLRLLLSELNYAKIQKGGDLEDSDVIVVVQKESKKRKEAFEAYKKGGRNEQADKESAELIILETYLPAQVSDEELTKVVLESINDVGATSISDMGKVIGVVMGKVGQGADGARVSALVKEKLNV